MTEPSQFKTELERWHHLARIENHRMQTVMGRRWVTEQNEDTQAPIVEFLQRNGEMTMTQLADAMRTSQQTMSNRLQRCMRRGVVKARLDYYDNTLRKLNFYRAAE